VPDLEVLQVVPDELKTRAELQGEASMRGHLAPPRAPSRPVRQSYVPPSERTTRR